MKNLLENYKKKLETINSEIQNIVTQDETNPVYLISKTKRTCYREIISELEGIIFNKKSKEVEVIDPEDCKHVTDWNGKCVKCGAKYC